MNKKAFTLVEMLIVIVIIGILAATIVPKIMGSMARARDTGRMSDVRQISQAINLYVADYRTIPTVSGTGYHTVSAISGVISEYLRSVPEAKGNGLEANADGHCQSEEEGYAYYGSEEDNIGAVTALLEGERGNTRNCRGLVSTNNNYDYYTDGYNLKVYDTHDDLVGYNPHPICNHKNLTIPQDECDALMHFYDSTGGDNWTTNTNRGTSPDVESWFGIQLTSGFFSDGKKRTRSILLGSYRFHGSPDNDDGFNKYTYQAGLSGRVPDSLSILSHLENLALGNNPDLSGDMNKFIEEMHKLQHLSASGPDMIFPSTIDFSEYRNLHSLYLWNIGSNSSQLSQINGLDHMNSLVRLHIANTKISQLPDLSRNSGLRTLIIGNNKNMEGTITDISDFPLMQYFIFSSNPNILGYLPIDYSNNNNLVQISVIGNTSLSSSSFPDTLCSLPNLKYIILHSAKIVGSLPDSCQNSSQFVQFLLQNNQMNRDSSNNIRMSPSTQSWYDAISTNPSWKNISNQSGPLVE